MASDLLFSKLVNHLDADSGGILLDVTNLQGFSHIRLRFTYFDSLVSSESLVFQGFLLFWNWIPSLKSHLNFTRSVHDAGPEWSSSQSTRI